MTVLWQIGTSSGVFSYFQKSLHQRPPTFRLINSGILQNHYWEILKEYADHNWWEAEAIAFRTAPYPVIQVHDDSFELDYFTFSALQFCSARLRKAWGDLGGAVLYHEVDANDCPSRTRNKDYKAFQVTMFGQPFDPTRTPGSVRDLRKADGTIVREWIPAYSSNLGTSIHYRDDFVPPAPLFRPIGTAWTLATDELAERVMRAGITDLDFQDIAGGWSPGETRDRKRHL